MIYLINAAGTVGYQLWNKTRLRELHILRCYVALESMGWKYIFCHRGWRCLVEMEEQVVMKWS